MAQVLREHRETLVSVMETFLHDPLCEWTKRHRSSEEADNPQAKDALATLEGDPLCQRRAETERGRGLLFQPAGVDRCLIPLGVNCLYYMGRHAQRAGRSVVAAQSGIGVCIII